MIHHIEDQKNVIEHESIQIEHEMMLTLKIVSLKIGKN